MVKLELASHDDPSMRLLAGFVSEYTPSGFVSECPAGFVSECPDLSEDEWAEYHQKRLTDGLQSVDWDGSGRRPLTETGLLALLKIEFHGQAVLERAAQLFDCAPSELRLGFTDEDSRPPLLPSPACVWGFGGITVEVRFEQTGGGPTPPSSPSYSEPQPRSGGDAAAEAAGRLAETLFDLNLGPVIHVHIDTFQTLLALRATCKGARDMIDFIDKARAALESNGLLGLCNHAAFEGDLKLLQFARVRLRCPWGEPPNACATAAGAGQLDCLKWARENHCDATLVCEFAAHFGQLHILEWARMQPRPCRWGMACMHAAEQGHLGVLQWLREKECPWHRDKVRRQAEGNGHAHIVDWIDRQPREDDDYASDERTYERTDPSSASESDEDDDYASDSSDGDNDD